ncbi:Hypothetical predicted protein [Podarcis lilfordi]|uniref:Uncharacterized protein n=1 Tax=Podarcis lilfordi TaxID=74358 RepID=A0AA35PB02_9SAUR|nr:Hypothetical predicted protein [Podarcis lilfordi]
MLCHDSCIAKGLDWMTFGDPSQTDWQRQQLQWALPSLRWGSALSLAECLLQQRSAGGGGKQPQRYGVWGILGSQPSASLDAPGATLWAGFPGRQRCHFKRRVSIHGFYRNRFL